MEIKKPLYRLNDASRKFWLKVKKVFKDIDLKKLDGDKAFYYKLDINGKLLGMLSSHVDNFNLAGTKEFLLNIMTK